MKKLLYLIVCLLLIMPFSVPASGENETQEIAAEAQKALFSAFDSETKDALASFGLDEIDPERIFDVSFESITAYFGTNLKEKSKDAVKMFFELLGALIIVFVFAGLKGEKNSDILETLSVCVFALLLSQRIEALLNSAVTIIDSLSKLMLGFVPVYAGIVAVSGSPVSAAGYSSLTLLFAQGVSAFSSKLLVPFCGVVICLTIAFSVNSRLNAGRFISAAGRVGTVSLGAISAFFTGFLALKNVLASSADAAGVRGLRFLVSNLIPVVGSAMSDAYSAFAGSINLIKGSVAVVGIVAVVVCTLPLVLELVLNLGVLSALTFAAEIASQKGILSLFKGFSVAVRMLLLALVYEVFIIIISTGLMLSVH